MYIINLVKGYLVSDDLHYTKFGPFPSITDAYKFYEKNMRGDKFAGSIDRVCPPDAKFD